jgi:transposase
MELRMPNFKKYNYNQDAMIVVNFEEQLQPNTFELALHRLIENHIDLSTFYDKYNNNDGGRSAYDPAILLKIILFAYSKGITSSREIQWQCEHNIIFKALSCDTVPHFTSIASFVSSYPDAIESVFEQVLLVCDDQGLLGHELLAIDGCKMASDAAKTHSGTLKELEHKREKIYKRVQHCMKEHRALDKRKPREKERKERLEQSIDSLEKHFNKIDQFLKTASPRMGRGKQSKEVKSNITDNESAKMKTNKGIIQGYNGIATVDKEHQIIVDAQAFGESAEHHHLQPVLKTVRDRYRRLSISKNIYKEGVVVTADTGFANEANNRYLKTEGINAYVPDNQFRSRDPRYNNQKNKYGKRHQDIKKGIFKVIPASDFSFNLKKKTARCPAGKDLWLCGERPTDSGKTRLFFEGNLTDCRGCELKRACMRHPESADSREGHGRQVSITVSDGKSATDWMKRRVDSKLGKYYYSHRMSVVEPVFGNIGTNKRLNKFSLRSKKKVQGQWQLYCLVHNIEKLMRYGDVA